MNLTVVNILPLTSRKENRKIYPNEVLVEKGKLGLEAESIILCYQVRTLDKEPLLSKYGTITDQIIQQKIVEAVCFQLGIQ